MRSLQSRDEAVYRHFKAELETRVERFGPRRMREATARLRRLTSLARRRCDASLDGHGHFGSPDCSVMSMNAYRFTRLFFRMMRTEFLAANPDFVFTEADKDGNKYRVNVG